MASCLSIVIASAAKQIQNLSAPAVWIASLRSHVGVRSTAIAFSGSGAARHQKKKAARFPERPFLSHGGCTFTSGDFGPSGPGAYLPIESLSAAAAFRDSRELWPEPNAMVFHLRKMGSLSRIARVGATTAQTTSPLFPLSTAA
ncbi:hypothetical protein [Bradyrhizobium sp. DASA03120]|uniref:hypothetical protein n=1 Tax=Bradyrhizobium sp. SMVTL-02 TaxID=3395917 RepID=UPI003F6F492E